jgi:rhodanese-related sulfurtransferase
MKKSLFKLSWLLVLAVLIGFTSCSSDDDDDDDVVTVNEFELLIGAVETANPVNSFPAMIKSSDVNSNVVASADQYIIDIRDADTYAAGHIEGAVNVAAGNVLAHYEENNLETYETVVIVCFSGQTAGWVSGLLHTMGYTNVKDMKWGMSSWNATTSGSWTGGIGNMYATQLVTTATDKAAAGAYPELTTGETVAADILKARVEAVFAEGFAEAKVSSATVFGALSSYYIVNYWSVADYDWGHIPGAIQYTPKEDVLTTSFLNTLPTDKPIAVYCYTGQTSAHLAAYLRVLGYDAKSILFGVNGMSYDEMPGTKFVEETDVHDYPLVP